jgi:asparagine synthase (glutamine-hydrolysing)
MPNNLKYDLKTNTGKILLQKIIQKLDLDNLITDRKQGFSVNTVNLWNNYGKEIFLYYFDNSRLIQNKIINSTWIKKHISKNDLDSRYVNKFLGILALEIWYRLFVTSEFDSNEKLQFKK